MSKSYNVPELKVMLFATESRMVEFCINTSCIVPVLTTRSFAVASCRVIPSRSPPSPKYSPSKNPVLLEPPEPSPLDNSLPVDVTASLIKKPVIRTLFRTISSNVESEITALES